MSARLTFESTRSLVLRAQPQAGAKERAQIPAGTRLTLLKGKEGWVQVRDGQKQNGWVPIKDAPALHRALERVAPGSAPPLVEVGAFAALDHTVQGVWGDRPELAEARSRLSGLAALAAPLVPLAHAAHAFLNGDPNAEAWLLTVLETKLVVQTPFGGEPDPMSATPTSLPGLPNPRFPGGAGWPCLIGPFAYGRLFEALRQLGGRFAPNEPQAPFQRLLGQLGANLAALEVLDALYAVARQVGQGEGARAFANAFWSLTATPTSGQLPSEPANAGSPATAEGTGIAGVPLPFPVPGDFQPFDLCRAMRWRETERLVRCFCRESYTVTRIVNQDRTPAVGGEYVGLACTGDVIIIEGRGFRDTRDWGLGETHQSEVVFSGRRSRGVAATEYREWSDTRVRVRVPDGASDGPIALRVICERTDVSECGIVLRPAAPGSSLDARRLTLPEPPVIEAFADRAGPWCAELWLPVRVANAEQVQITRDDGSAVPFPEGAPGPARDVEGALTLAELETMTYRLEARNACHTVSGEATVRRVRQFTLSHDAQVRAGAPLELRLEQYCSAGRLGRPEVRYGLTFEDPDGVLVDPPDQVAVVGTATSATVTIAIAAGACGQVFVTASAAEPDLFDRPEVRSGFYVFDVPHLTDARAVGANACDPFQVELTGDCLTLDPGQLRVRLVDTDSGAVLHSHMRVLRVDAGPERPSRGVRVLVETPDRVGGTPLGVQVEQFGLTSNTLSLAGGRALLVPQASILEFSSSRTSVYRAGPLRDVALRYRVKNARKVELWASGGRVGRAEGVLRTEDGPGPACATWSGTFNDRINLPLTYELRAYGFRGRTATQTITIEDSRPATPPPMRRGVRQLEIFNCDADRNEIVVWTRTVTPAGRWEEHGRVDHGYNEWGTCPSPGADSVTVTFDEGVLYELRIVVPDRSTCGGRNDPTYAGCLGLERVFILGDSDGYELAYAYSGGTPLVIPG